MRTIVVNNYFNKDLSFLPEGKLVVYDKKDLNVGSNIYDYMDWIVKNYAHLPEIVMFAKGNMLERHITKEEFDKVKENKTLTPLMTMNHKTYMPICYYKDGLYWERNDFWYKNEHPHKYFEELIDLLGVRNKEYLGFSPGACWIVPRENILKQPKWLYNKLKFYVSHDSNPAEAHLIERSLYHLWS